MFFLIGEPVALYRPRIIDSVIEEYLSAFGGIWIRGPKWCGKTWTSAHHANSAVYLDDSSNIFQSRRLAETSPDLVLSGDAPHLIDEWLDVPAIWDGMKLTGEERRDSSFSPVLPQCLKRKKKDPVTAVPDESHDSG